MSRSSVGATREDLAGSPGGLGLAFFAELAGARIVMRGRDRLVELPARMGH